MSSLFRKSSRETGKGMWELRKGKNIGKGKIQAKPYSLSLQGNSGAQVIATSKMSKGARAFIIVHYSAIG